MLDKSVRKDMKKPRAEFRKTFMRELEEYFENSRIQSERSNNPQELGNPNIKPQSKIIKQGDKNDSKK